MIYLIKSPGPDGKQFFMKLTNSEKPWTELKKKYDLMNCGYTVIREIPGGSMLKKKMVSKLSRYSLPGNPDWYIYSPETIKIIEDSLKKSSISRTDLLKVLKTPGRMNKKLELICNYLLGSPKNDLIGEPLYEPFKDIIQTYGIDKISSMKYRYNQLKT